GAERDAGLFGDVLDADVVVTVAGEQGDGRLGDLTARVGSAAFAQRGPGHASFYSFWHALTSLACYAGSAARADRKCRRRVRAGEAGLPGDVPGAGAAVPVAGEQAEAGPAASRRVRGPGALAQRGRFMAHTSRNDIN